MHIYEVLKRPLQTEKMTYLRDLRQYAFEVDERANKTQVKGGLPVFNDTYDERTLNADAQYDIAMRPWEFKDRVWNTVNPLLQGLVGNFGGGETKFGLVGGENTALPKLQEILLSVCSEWHSKVKFQ